ncbi:hypothetical protein F949_00007 [Acinetobacter junii NIPH 182]|uniref:hypothetical protein n=1 Tax=Acinetobacter junii TaxID=40215 RepID=UPI0002CEF36C|nr:hypothetical protein [Acinetobacter junii]ENV65108.1 hypothetical protein F949_00007 [Acinetobacter junii NIPH 182]
MFSPKAVQNVVRNHLDLDSSFQKNGDTYTRYNEQNVKFNVHFCFTSIQIFKGSNANPTWIYILRAENQKELELQVKDYLKFIEDNTK